MTGSGAPWDARLSSPGSPVCAPDWLVLRDDPLLSVTPSDALLNRWLFAGARSGIRDTFVAGRQVIADGHEVEEAQ